MVPLTARIYLPVHFVVLIVAVDEGHPVETLLDSANALALPMLPCTLEKRTFFLFDCFNYSIFFSHVTQNPMLSDSLDNQSP